MFTAPRLTAAALLFAASIANAAPADLPVPHHAAVAPGAAAQTTLLAARRYAAFWNTGDASFAKAALADDFIDRTLPAGRPQGSAGPLAASKGFRTAVPDLHAEIDDIVVTGDRAAVHLHFTGHFTGTFGDTKGAGQTVDFQAFDLYRVDGRSGRIAENWHLEDNQTLMQQLGLAK
jgi:predicted ester cyclase